LKSKQAHTSTVEHLLRLWFDSNAEAQSMAVPDLQPAAAWIHLEFGRDGVDRNQCRNQLATTNRAALHLLLACKANAANCGSRTSCGPFFFPFGAEPDFLGFRLAPDVRTAVNFGALIFSHNFPVC